MPTYTKLKSGSWRVQVRRKRQHVANTFIRPRDAEEWAIEAERPIDRGTPIRRSKSHEQPRIFSDLIALHLDDLAQVGKPVRRSKSMVLKALRHASTSNRINRRFSPIATSEIFQNSSQESCRLFGLLKLWFSSFQANSNK
jgi:hypothetical protein